ncbi:MAG: phosphotransferase [Propionibacteriaceae bacterium]|nr:phosphotransferase [Propionibacteriaceae bacterium]
MMSAETTMTGADAFAALAGKDPALPVGLVTDDRRLDAWMAERGARLGARRWLRYKPETSLCASFDMTVEGADRAELGWLLAVVPSSQSKIAKVASRAPEGSIVSFDEAGGIVLARPAADRQLAALRDPAATMAALGLGDLTVKTVVHNPQRRWVARARGAGRDLVIRGYTAGEAAPLVARMRACADLGPVLPVVAFDEKRDCVAVPFVGGQVLGLPTRAAGDGRGFVASIPIAVEVGEALGRLHATPVSADLLDVFGQSCETVDGIAVTSARAAREIVDDAAGTAAMAGILLPELVPALDDIIAELETRIPPVDATIPVSSLVLSHGDFSFDQVVLGHEGEISLIDWDRIRLAPAADDLAHAYAAGLDADDPVAPPEFALAMEPLWNALLKGYATVRPLPEAGELRARCAAAILTRLTQPFRRSHPQWPSHMKKFLAHAHSVLG